ncbi:MAG: ATP-binding protein [Symploca sp. SIO2G7]|nr:ATP-binding protein [Symploca sp. SIO2G7]
MTQVFGEYREKLPSDHEFLLLGFSPSSIPIQQRWRNNGLSADFIADYLMTFFPINDEQSSIQARQAEIKSGVSYIANELLENAMKFHDKTSSHPIKFGIYLLEDTVLTVLLQATNSVSPPNLDKFQAFVQELTNSDPEELFIRQLEKNAEDENFHNSGLGLLTMINDWNAKLGWKIETFSQEPEVVTVTTVAQLII